MALVAGCVAAVTVPAIQIGGSWDLLALLAVVPGGVVGASLYRWGRNKHGAWHGGPGVVAIGVVIAASVAGSSAVIRLLFSALVGSFLLAVLVPIFGPFVRAVVVYVLSRASQPNREF